MPISMPIEMPLGHLLNHAIAAEEIVCQTNASSGGERCRFCKLQGHAERVCRKKMKAESTRKTSGNKELKGDSGFDIEDNIDFMEWKSHPPVHGRRTNQCMWRGTSHQNGTGHGGSSVHQALPIRCTKRKWHTSNCGNLRFI